MIRQLEASHDNVIGYSVSGEVTEDEYQQAVSEVRDAIARHGKVRLLYRISDVSVRSFLTALDERFRFLQEHRDDIERVAIVSDDTATGLLSQLTESIAPIETRHFPRDDEQTAWAWLE